MAEWLKTLKLYVENYNKAIKEHLPEELVCLNWNAISSLIYALNVRGVEVNYLDDINEGITSLKVTIDMLKEDGLNA